METTIPKLGFLHRKGDRYYVELDTRSVEMFMCPSRYKVIGLPKKKDYDGDNYRWLYYYGVSNGRLILHVKRLRCYKTERGALNVCNKLVQQFSLPKGAFTVKITFAHSAGTSSLACA